VLFCFGWKGVADRSFKFFGGRGEFVERPLNRQHVRLLIDRIGWFARFVSCDDEEVRATLTDVAGVSSLQQTLQQNTCGALPGAALYRNVCRFAQVRS
jgi:hypothetical protein